MAVKNAKRYTPSPQPISFWQRLLQDEQRLFLYQKICIFLLAFFVFANSIPNDYNIDDIYYTTEENAIANKGLGAIGEIFTTHTLHDHNNNVFDYRPIPMLTFALQHQLFGAQAGIGHCISVLLYAWICLLAFILLCKFFGRDNRWLVFLSMLLYVVHPLHTEVVDNIKCRDELMATLFGLFTINHAWKWYTTGKHKHLVWSILLVVAGMLCKQTILVYVVIVPFVFYFFTDMPVRKMLLISGGMLVCAYVAIRLPNMLLPEKHRVFYFFENPFYIYRHAHFDMRAATASAIMGWYALLHLVPHPLSFYYGYSYVPLFHWGLYPVLGLIPYLLLGYFIVRNIRKKTPAAFGAVVYVAGIAPFTNLVGIAPGMMAERFTFGSSLGFCILLVSALCYFFKVVPSAINGNKNANYFLGTLLLIFVSYTGITMQRNTLWKDSWTLYSHDIRHLQNSVKANMMYAQEVTNRVNNCMVLYNSATGAEQEMYRDSIQYYKLEYKNAYLRAVNNAPNVENSLNNLGIAYMNLDSFERAKVYLLRARAIAPNNADIRGNLAVTMGQLSEHNTALLDSAIQEFQTSLRLEPKNSTAAYGLSLMYMRRKDTAEAVTLLQESIKQMPDDPLLYVQLSTIYLYKGDAASAISNAEKGAAAARPDAYLYQMLQNLYHDQHNTERENYYKAKLQAVLSAPR